MTKNVKHGIASLGLAVLLFIPLFFESVVFSFFRLMTESSAGAPALYIMIILFGWLTFISVLALVLTGILLILNFKTEKVLKITKILMYIAGTCAVLTGLFTIIWPVSEKAPLSSVGYGAYVIIILGIIGLLTPFISKKLIKK